MRGSHLTNIFAIESFMDELARKRGIDPATFRRDLVKTNPRATHIIDTVKRMADWGKKRDGSALGFTYMNYSGTQIALVAEVVLDRNTGALRIPRIWTALDPGIAVQPDNIVAQTESSIVYGLGFALTERITIANGAVQEFEFLRLSRAAHERDPGDVHRGGPDQQPSDRCRPDGDAAGRARDRQRGRGTIAGVRLRHTPMTPDRVKQALG